MKVLRILFVMIIIWMSPSCEQKNARLWVDFSNTSYGARAARTTAGDPYIGNFSFVDDAYSLLGGQVEFSGSVTLTPSSFILPFTEASIGCEIHTIGLSVPWYNLPVSERNEATNIDFCNPISWEIDGEIWPEVYNTIYMRISSTQRPLYTYDGETNGVIWETPVLEVTVPGYSDADWPDQENDGIFLRKYLGNNKFRFDLSLVLPTIKDQYGKTAFPIENYIFCSDYSNPGIVLPGLDGFPEFINPLYYGYLGLPDQGADVGTEGGTNSSLVLFPFENVELSEDTTLVFYVETEGIVTVYDNNTPAYKPDDKLMLVRDFYNHFGVRTE